MNPQVVAGRRYVLGVIAVLLALHAYSVVAFYSVFGPVGVPQQVVRSLLTIVLAVFLYRGANWARWATGILCAVGTVWGAVMLVRLQPSGILVLGAMACAYAVCVIILMATPAVRAFFNFKRLQSA